MYARYMNQYLKKSENLSMTHMYVHISIYTSQYNDTLNEIGQK